MEPCTFHPEHAAIEVCESCARPLCALCLWYTASGHRLCRRHARESAEAGEQILPPQTYHEAFAASLAQNPAGAAPAGGYRGNNNDLGALVAAVAGLTTLVSCFGGVYCLPVVVLVLGAAAYFNADQSVEPRRTRRLALLGIGVVALLLLLMLAFILLYAAFFAVLILSGAGP